MSETQTDKATPHEEILTLAEAAAYLRVPEDALSAMVSEDAIPAQNIGGQWRFLKLALTDWLRYGPNFYREFRRFPPLWMFEYPPAVEMFRMLEARLLSKVEAMQSKPVKPGSKQAVLKHFGVFRDDSGIDDMLAKVYARRKAETAEGEE